MYSMPNESTVDCFHHFLGVNWPFRLYILLEHVVFCLSYRLCQCRVDSVAEILLGRSEGVVMRLFQPRDDTSGCIFRGTSILPNLSYSNQYASQRPYSS